MELKEHRHQNGYDPIEHEGDLDDNILNEKLLILFLRTKVIRIKGPHNTFKPCDGHGYDDKIRENLDVEEQQQEKLSVPKSDAVVYPRAVMVHV